MPGRTHNREFKREIVSQVESGQKTTAQLSREHHLSPSLIHRWRKEVEARGEAAFTDQARPDPTLEQRIAELERFCGQLSLENTILKKLLATYHSSIGTK
ncbi:Transposase and inactivated derivatives [Deinococcus reticulitermitis]|uniref:Transposase and inactivated derivatives n=1 Tax=Deinococcus reticulitermitis TaxID=856736 RepID=A0A1H7CWH7_9DEIO|nr:transposase [Deinococcus reticulitermitis]SEJ91080.1 Transposase and inactivated derivatives [Deinococcus reticulitermitis]